MRVVGCKKRNKMNGEMKMNANEMNAVLLDPGGEDAKMNAEMHVNAKMNTAMNAMNAEMNENGFDATAGVSRCKSETEA